MEMEKYNLSNGITLVFEKNSSKSVAVEVMFKVGSNDESEKIFGISHYLEHMLFEGTKKRKTSREISNEIEKYGGEFNAYTSGNRTAFYIKIINKKFDVALDILSDMVKNSVFDEKIMEKEKKVVLKEINMVTDDPRQHQWILFQKNLFVRHPAKNPTYGTVKAVKGITRNILIDYYQNHYLPNNMIISVVGNVDKVKEKIHRYFGDIKPKKLSKKFKVTEPIQKSLKKFVEKRKIENSYIVLGYKTTTRLDKDSYVLDVINGVLGRGQSGWMFDEIRNKRGLAYQVGVNAEMDRDYGYFAVFCGLGKEKIDEAKNIILQQFRKLENLTEKDLDEAKMFVEGNYVLNMENNFHAADDMAFWETIKDASLSEDYIKNIKKVTVKDVRRVAGKYLNDKYTLVVIEQE